MKAMIFAAGLGTRLKPLTDTMPKALVPVSGEPLLARTVKTLRAAGLGPFVVNVHHFADRIRGYLASDPEAFGDVMVSDESDMLLETGGGILHARELLQGGEEGRFLVHNVDILSNLDIPWFLGSWRPGTLAMLLVSDRKTSRYLLFDDDMKLVGWTNVTTGEVRTPYPSLDPAQCRKYAFSGIHLMSDCVFAAMDSEGMSGRFPIMDFYLRTCSKYPIYGVAAPSLELVDVGKLDSLSKAEDFILNLSRRSCP